VGLWEEEYDSGLSYEQWPIPRIFKSKESISIFVIQSMTTTFKVGDLIAGFDRGRLMDLGIIQNVLGGKITYSWLGVYGQSTYDFTMTFRVFEQALKKKSYMHFSCDSDEDRELKKLSILLKYLN
jgi:hypothetical protein